MKGSLPMINQIPPETLDFKCKSAEAFFNHDGETMPLVIDGAESASITDPNGIWNIEDHGIILEYLIGIDNLRTKAGYGFPDGMEIGLGYRILSYKSRQRIAGELIDLSLKDEMPLEYRARIDIPSKKFRDSIDVELFIYVIESPDASYLPGTIICNLFRQSIALSGDASEFPIHISPLDDKILWKVNIDYEDPFDDLFYEHVQVIINSKSDLYGDLKINSSPLKSAALREIMAQSIVLLINKVMEDGYLDKILTTENFVEGSVAMAVKNFLANIEGYSDPLSLNEEIREYVRKCLEDDHEHTVETT